MRSRTLGTKENISTPARRMTRSGRRFFRSRGRNTRTGASAATKAARAPLRTDAAAAAITPNRYSQRRAPSLRSPSSPRHRNTVNRVVYVRNPGLNSR
jgi:hypothetical protein